MGEGRRGGEDGDGGYGGKDEGGGGGVKLGGIEAKLI